MSLSLSICKNDGLVFLNPRWSSDEYNHFYSNEYDSYYRPHQIVSNPDYINKTKKLGERLFYQINDRLSLLSDITLNFNEVLELGSGPGHILVNFSTKHSSNVYAIEPSSNCKKELAKINVNLVSNDLSNDWHVNLENKFTFVYSRHVIEHTLDPLEVLKKVNFVLSDNGIFYVSVPNTLQPMRSLRGFWFRVVHTFYFSEHTFSKLCYQSNFQIIKIHFDRSHSDMTFILKKNMDKHIKPKVNLKFHFVRVFIFFSCYEIIYYSKKILLMPFNLLKSKLKVMF